MKVPLFTLKKQNSENFLYYYLCYSSSLLVLVFMDNQNLHSSNEKLFHFLRESQNSEGIPNKLNEMYQIFSAILDSIKIDFIDQHSTEKNTFPSSFLPSMSSEDLNKSANNTRFVHIY